MDNINLTDMPIDAFLMAINHFRRRAKELRTMDDDLNNADIADGCANEIENFMRRNLKPQQNRIIK